MYEQRARTFTGVSAFLRDYVVITVVDNELAEQDIDHAVIFRFANGTWGKKTLDHAICHALILDQGQQILNVGVEGKISILTLPGISEEHVDASDSGPGALVPLRGAFRDGAELYAVGMARQAYRRSAEGTWSRIDQNCFVRADARVDAVGFNGLHGRSISDIYAVGYGGEIWHFDGVRWQQQDSGCSITLTAVICDPDGGVFACGLGGVILRRRQSQWIALPQHVTCDFWSMASFDGALFLASSEGVFRLDGDIANRIDLGASLSTGHLDAADGRIWSVGPNDIAYSDDAIHWRRLDNP